MHIDPARVWKTDTPGYVVVLDAECRYDHQVHGRYLAAERCTPPTSPSSTRVTAVTIPAQRRAGPASRSSH